MKKAGIIPFILITGYILYSLGFSMMNATYEFVTLQQIQIVGLDTLAFGRDKSPYNNDSVEFVARVVAPPRVSPANGDNRTLLRGTSSWTCYAQDTANGLWGGIVIRQGTRNVQTGIDFLDTGALIRVRGVVQEFGSTQSSNFANTLTQLALDTADGYTISILGSSPKRPTAKLVNVSEFSNGDYPNGGTINYLEGEKYEGMYVELRNVTVAAGVGNRQPWSVVDENGNKLYFRDFSNFFSTSPSGDTLRPWTHPAIGTFVNYIRGVIITANNEGAFGSQLPYAIIPIYPNDLSLGNPPPQLSSPLRNPGVPTPSDSVQVSVTATDPGLSMTLTNMKVYWRTNGGSFSNKDMPLVTGNIYSTKMPPASLGTFVEYFFRAEDNSGNVKLLPNDTLRSKLFYYVRANDSMSVQDVQFCPNNGGRSAFEGYDVRGVEGVVTADTSDIPGISFSSPGGTQTSPRRVYIQNGTGPFSGIWLSGSPTDALRKGDRVRVRGTVEENFSCTRINISTSSDIAVLSQGNPLPSPQILTTAQLANNKSDGDTTIEKWESVFCRFDTPITINCANAGLGIACTSTQTLQDTAFRRNYGEILVADQSGIEARIELQDGNHSFTNNWDGNGNQAGLTLLTKNDIIAYNQGILYFAFGNYKLVPRTNPDFGAVTPVGISNISEIAGSYDLMQNYPNPFNPSTTIKFSLPASGKVMLKVFDITGREITTLVNGTLNSGTYSARFDAFNFASGTYFYSLQVEDSKGGRFAETKKMILIK